ncbi:MAG: hypothetical protein AAGF06_06245 [Pseudomonadota bacterium]
MQLSNIMVLSTASLGLMFSSQLVLAKAGAINLKMNTFKEVVVKDKQNKPKVKLEKIDSAVPGDNILYLVEYKNVSKQTVDAGAAINNPVPKNTLYVPNSAYCDDCTITFSINGKAYAPIKALRVTSANGKKRPATHKDIKYVRWTLNNPITPKASGALGYKVQIKQHVAAAVSTKAVK